MLTLDLADVNAIPHICIHVRAPAGRRAWVSRPDALAEREAFREEVALKARAAMRRAGISEPLSGLLRVRIRVWRRCARGRGADWDNLAKEICDGFTRAGIWEDDSQIVDGGLEIVAQGPHVRPRITVTVQGVGQDETDPEHGGDAMSP